MRSLFLILLLLAPLAEPLTAQAPVRQGFWFGGGLGAGAGTLHCGICSSAGHRGTTGHLRAGFTLNRRLLLGAELGGWLRDGDGGSRRILSLSGGAWWYPAAERGWFLRGGAGLARWRAAADDEALVSSALALVLGAGYDARVNPVLSVVPYLNLLGSASGALWLESRDEVSFERRRLPAGGHTLLLQLGVGLIRH